MLDRIRRYFSNRRRRAVPVIASVFICVLLTVSITIALRRTNVPSASAANGSSDVGVAASDAPAALEPHDDDRSTDNDTQSGSSGNNGEQLIGGNAESLPSRTPMTREAIYAHTLRSTVWIIGRLPNGLSAMGTGCIIDGQCTTVLTNDHVVKESSDLVVFVPEFDNEGNVIVEREHYFRIATPIPARTIRSHSDHDLAIIRLERRIADGVPIAFSGTSARPGQNVHTVGNPGTSGGLWVYTSGTVRQVYHGRFETDDGSTIDAKVVETQNPTNQGDSGGPVVNDFGDLVALTQSHSKDARLVSICIDISEIRSFVEDLPD
jgi:S1-C subfamily serine protease